ncbi:MULTISPECIES: DUF1624 domain-containing protein [Flavobacterium]|uniref:Heparan-alpha-glucosaminide N-acetyltransferase catalytic domain-containing protein n=1 Tax=Flavobacterium salmonis TaxID=2654844 RepID=A0A6V6Z6J1_9FLAO|nr:MULTISPECIES: hypothetical protein [Flavobacterium]OOV17744.1 hypothetical protein BXU10_16960 [Flavobacterium sp. LM4]CAD0007403.1 hypothetical protein FLAT13_03838 [Flavobacterium salmonis]
MTNQSTFKTYRTLLGIVMAFAILDHTRLFFHYWNTNPADLDHTTWPLFFTRFISHYFAPAVFFITGMELFHIMGKKTKTQNVWYLLSLGSALILIEIFINNFLYTFDIYYRTIGVFIIGSLGLCIFCMAGFQYFSRTFILVISLSIIAGHHLLDPIQFEGHSMKAVLWYLLHQQKYIPLGQNMYIINYTILPWLGIILSGYFFGFYYRPESSAVIRKKILLYSGWISICLFFLLRSINDYGESNPWKIEVSTAKTILSFFNLTKYPASLDYILITLGPVFLFLAYAENLKNKISDFFFTLGNYPLLTYLFSTFIIHLAAMLSLYFQSKPLQMMIITSASYNNESPLSHYGYSLSTVYILSSAFILICYFTIKRIKPAN